MESTKVFQISFEDEHRIVEAVDIAQAIDIWRDHRAEELETQLFNVEWPESVSEINDSPVLRSGAAVG